MTYPTPYDEVYVQICCRRLKQKDMIIIEADGGEVGKNSDEDGGGVERCSAVQGTCIALTLL
jgi:hypothetical protein